MWRAQKVNGTHFLATINFSNCPGTVGISGYAADALGDIVYVQVRIVMMMMMMMIMMMMMMMMMMSSFLSPG